MQFWSEQECFFSIFSWTASSLELELQTMESPFANLRLSWDPKLKIRTVYLQWQIFNRESRKEEEKTQKICTWWESNRQPWLRGVNSFAGLQLLPVFIKLTIKLLADSVELFTSLKHEH